MQNFSQIGEVPWPTLTQILQNMPLNWYQLEVENKMRLTIRRINLSLENESLQTSDRQLNTEEREKSNQGSCYAHCRLVPLFSLTA